MFIMQVVVEEDFIQLEELQEEEALVEAEQVLLVHPREQREPQIQVEVEVVLEVVELEGLVAQVLLLYVI